MKRKILLLALPVIMLLAGCSGGSKGTSSAETSSVSTVAKTPKQKFMQAKTNTYESTTYEYTYDLSAKIKFNGATSFTPAELSGTVQYNADGGETTYVQKKTTSGALIFDSTTYTYNVGNDLIKLNENENKDFSVVDYDTITANYDFETNSIGVILKSLADNDNINVTYEDSKYNLAFKTSFAQDSILHLLNKIDSDKIVNVLNKYTTSEWGVGLAVTCYATLNDDEQTVKNFHFDTTISIKDTVDIVIGFDQTFTKFGGGITLNLPKMESTFTSKDDINSKLADVKTALDNAKKAYYLYDLKTKVDHGVSKGNPFGMAVDSHSQGYAERQIIGDEVYFHNGLELDSDYKNDDQYPEDIEDYKYTRAKVNNETKDVYDVNDGILKNTYFQVENYNNDAVDDYYMMIDDNWLSADFVKILRATKDGTNTVYKLGIGSEGVKTVLEYYNKSIRLDAEGTKWIDVYDIDSNFMAKSAEFLITVNDSGNITDISFVSKGFYNMSDNDDVKYTINLQLQFKYDKDSYEAPTEYKKISLPNYDVIG